MAASTAKKQNAISGTSELTLHIHDLNTLDTITAQLEGNPDIAPRITNIQIVNAEPEELEFEDLSTENANPPAEQTEEKGRELRIQNRIKRNAALDQHSAIFTSPITKILSQITDLSIFSWTSEETSSRFTRPASFWSALWKHASTLVDLRLEFFEHEVQNLPALPPNITFPCLTRLELDTSSAHGDEGVVIDALLKSVGGKGSGLKSLKFEWPGCDLESCQIQNVSWVYDFPTLQKLSLRGWDFAPERLAKFFESCAGVEWFSDAISGPYVDYEDDDKSQDNVPALSSITFPNLKGLYFDPSAEKRSLRDYFDKAANRPLEYLAVCQQFETIRCLPDLLHEQSSATTILKKLDIYGGVEGWRPALPEDTDSEDDEYDDGMKDQQETEPRLPQILREILPSLQNLEKLGLSLSSTYTTYWDSKTNEETHPPPMNADDLQIILSVLPARSKLQVLKLWDTRGEALQKDILDGLIDVPESLEYLVWQAERPVVYRFVRGDGRVRVEEFDGEDVWGEGEEGMVDVWGCRGVWMSRS